MYLISRAINLNYPHQKFTITLNGSELYFGINYTIKSKNLNRTFKQSHLLINNIKLLLDNQNFLKLYGLENINNEIKIKARKNKLKTIWKS